MSSPSALARENRSSVRVRSAFTCDSVEDRGPTLPAMRHTWTCREICTLPATSGSTTRHSRKFSRLAPAGGKAKMAFLNRVPYRGPDDVSAASGTCAVAAVAGSESSGDLHAAQPRGRQSRQSLPAWCERPALHGASCLLHAAQPRGRQSRQSLPAWCERPSVHGASGLLQAAPPRGRHTRPACCCLTCALR